MDTEQTKSHAHSIYLLRTMQQQHIIFSAMADQNANMLLGVASVDADAGGGQRHAGQSATDDGIHEAMLHDVYQQGLVLKLKKYRYLGYAYRIFIAGIVLTLLALLLAFVGY